MRKVTFVFVLLSAIHSVVIGQQNNDVFIKRFMESMSAFDDLSPYIDIPDTLINQGYIVNMVSVENYEITEIKGNVVKIAVDPGIGKLCGFLTFRIDVENRIKMEFGEIEYNEMMGKYFIDPWQEYENRCRD